jgi:GT2 family glycosyltransferase
MPYDPRDLAVLIVCHNGRQLLPDCLSTLFASPDAPPARQVMIVDNASTDDSAQWLSGPDIGPAQSGGSAPSVPSDSSGGAPQGDAAEQTEPHVPPAATSRCCTLVRSSTNLGFAGGNNLGFAQIRSQFAHVKYVALLNQDTCVAPGWLAAMARVLEDHPAAAAVQAKLMLHPEITRFNSAGNWSHFLGFGFVTAFEKFDTGQFDRIREIDFPSGAAMMIRLSDISAGEDLFAPAFGSYLEDAELGWRLRLRGRHVLYAPASVVYHKYHFARNPAFYENLERNRWFLLAECYRLRTLLLLLPAILLMEAGLLVFFIAKGMPGAKFRAVGSVFDSRWRAHLAARRRAVQSSRTISDHELTARFGARIDFPHIRNPLLEHLGNPLLAAYWSIARRLIFW